MLDSFGQKSLDVRFFFLPSKKVDQKHESLGVRGFRVLESGLFGVSRKACGDAAVRDHGSLCIDAVHGGPSP